jgi:endogenous inhibitor of DNA gyrase (YacG/DUF329 family)
MPGQYIEWPDYPFCSARCRKIDLGRWLGESYRVPAEDQEQRDRTSDTEEQ